MDLQLERLLARGKEGGALSKRIMEINPRHRVITALVDKASTDKTAISDSIWLLYDSARIAEGEPVSDPAAFAKRFADALAKSVAV